MKLVNKRIICSLLLATILLGIAQTAVAATSAAGIAIDAFNPALDEFLSETLDAGTFNISTEEFIGKKGTIYFNFDKEKMLMVGDTTYRTYEFTDKLPFLAAIYTVCMVFDMNEGLLDLGVKLYWVNNNEAKQITKDELSQISAQMATMLN